MLTSVYRTKRLKLHIVRGAIGVIAINLGFYSLQILPLATVTALFFTTPLFVTVFSIPLLKEKVGLRRAGASVLGFAGAVIVIGYLPEPISAKWTAPILASIAFSLTLILGKKLSTNRTSRNHCAVFRSHVGIGKPAAGDAGLGNA